MTSSDEIKTLLLELIPEDMKDDRLVTNGLIKLAVINMGAALGIEDMVITEEVNEQDEVVYNITPELTLKQVSLASYFAYGLYLEKLKLSLNQDAINFSTLTFSIKGLEKRPEAINDSIYYNKRYLESQIDMLNGSSVLLGTAKQFGSTTNID